MLVTRSSILTAMAAVLMAATFRPAAAQPKAPRPAPLAIDKSRSAVLIMDYQNDIVGMLPPKVQAPLLERAATILKSARAAGLPVIYIVVRFRDGYPEVNLRNKLFGSLKGSGRFREGTPGAEVHAKVAPRMGDVIVTKRRVGAFSTTDLETIPRANNINTLVLLGISTTVLRFGRTLLRERVDLEKCD